MDDYGTVVVLLARTKPVALGEHDGVGLHKVNSAEDLIEWAGRLCYDTEGATGTRPGWIRSRIKDGHLSILEHASATFYIRCSRVVTHELVRHRIASYSQRSQRYVKENEPRYITPPGVSNSLWFHEIMSKCWEGYNTLIRQGVDPEIARYLLPNACQTEIVMTMNFRELRHFIALRTSPRALPEMQEVAGKVKSICKELAPEVFEDV